MSKITEITRPFLRDARDEIEAALSEFAEKYGIAVSVGNASFTPGPGGYATFKLELATKTPAGEVNTKQAADFNLYCYRYGLKPEHLNREISFAGRDYKIIGLMPKSSRYPLLAERVDDGKHVKLPIEAARLLKD